MGPVLRILARAAFVIGVLVVAQPACSQGEGGGSIQGTLNAPDCWTGSFELGADFFAANPYKRTMLLRIQSGSDFQTFSDGFTILINDTTKIRPDTTKNFAGAYKQPLVVDLPPEVKPPGTPVVANASPALVNMELYLQKSCQTQDVALHVVKEVTLPTDKDSATECAVPAMEAADPQNGCAAGAAAAGLGSGKSFISFTSVSNGKLDESIAAERLNSGCFDVYLADPRDAQAGGQGPAPPCRGHIRGTFSFFYERGKPSQPFP